MKLPLKTRVFTYAIDNSPFTLDMLMESLSAEYKEEKQFTTNLIEKYLVAYCGVNVIKPVESDAGDTKILQFTITEFGRQNLKYLPKN